MPIHRPFTDTPDTWWDPDGPFWTLHSINPLRLNYILSVIQKGTALDIGCGGGILSESLADSFEVTGIDIDEQLIGIAKSHAQKNDASVQYYHKTLDDIKDQHYESYDLVTCLEVLEHADNPQKMIHDIAPTIKPGGYVFFSTLNRNVISYLGAIVAAEYILKILPKHTHEYRKFITPNEMILWANTAGLELKNINGIIYNPIFKSFSIGQLTTINYIACFQKKSA